MYKVFYDDQLLYLPGDQELIIFNTKLELADNKSGSFEFDIPAVNPMYDKMKKLTSVSIFYGRILSMEKNFYNTRTVVCEGELAYLLDSIQEPKAYHGYTVRSFLNTLLAVHNRQTTMEKRLAVTFNSKCAGEHMLFLRKKRRMMWLEKHLLYLPETFMCTGIRTHRLINIMDFP